MAAWISLKAQISEQVGEIVFAQGQWSMFAPDKAKPFDVWFRAKVQEALDDPSARVNPEEVEAQFAALRAAAVEEEKQVRLKAAIASSTASGEAPDGSFDPIHKHLLDSDAEKGDR